MAITDLKKEPGTRKEKRATRVIYRNRSMRIHDYLVALAKDLNGALSYKQLNEIYMTYGMKGIQESLEYLKKRTSRKIKIARVKAWIYKWTKIKIR